MPRLRSVLVLSLAAASIHCASSSSDPSEEDESVASESEALVTHCWADIERPLPTASILPIGTTLTLRTSTNIHCPQGVSEKLVYRFYVDGPNGTVFATPDGTWGTRLQTFDTSTLPPARYRIFAYSMPASMVTAWVANDPVARAAPHRTSYSYVTMVQTHWATGTWSACSSQCGDGTETRTVTCVDQSHVERDGMCAGDPPAASGSCNPGACTYSWSTGEWGACVANTGSCGSGAQTRVVTCKQDQGGATVDASLCSGTAPGASQSCDAGTCPPATNTLIVDGRTFSVVPNGSWEMDDEEGQYWIWAYEPNDAWELGLSFTAIPTASGDYGIWDGNGWPQPSNEVGTYFWRNDGYDTFNAPSGGTAHVVVVDGRLHVQYTGRATDGSASVSMSFDYVLPSR